MISFNVNPSAHLRKSCNGMAALAGLGTYGALAIWASIVAAGSNLEAYILVAKIVSFVSSIKISVGGTTTAAATVAAIGGLIIIFIALSVTAIPDNFFIHSFQSLTKIDRKILR
ncbi:MAG: hypothetical protein OXC62_06870 [Aestuariivita sp.]|nr:hypothetical protein [Aestuariivita sp.]